MPPGQIIELRVLKAKGGTQFGFFDDPERFVASLEAIRGAKGIYITPNTVNPALFSRSPNQVRQAGKGECSSDVDIVERRWLLIDADPQREDKSQSASDSEHEAAIARAEAIAAYLSELGWPEPIMADSGNGAHLMYRVELPADDGGLVERCLKSLAESFDDDQIKVDTSVHNPARIWKLYGSLACKGTDTAERPHRMARLLQVPDQLLVVDRKQLESLAQPKAENAAVQKNPDLKPFDVDEFIRRHDLKVNGPDPWRDTGRRWTFLTSPMCEHHGDGPFIVQFENGSVSAGCHHDSCLWRWQDLRKKFEPDAYRQPARWADPGIIARELITANKIEDISTRLFWNETFWKWLSGRYLEISGSEVRAEIVNYMERDWCEVKSQQITNVVEHLRAKAFVSGEVTAPAWLGEQPQGFEPFECLATTNRIIHLPSFINGSDSYEIPATPAFLTVNACDFELDLDAPRPLEWIEFLNSLWKDDPQSIETLQELFGYLLTADTRQQKIFLLIGPPRSGKGTIARVLRRLVGEGNVAAPTLSGLTTNFGCSSLIGKSLAIVSDARLSTRNDQAVVVERLLAISGEDKLTIDRKHQPAVHCQLPTRFLILSNELPRLTDASGTIVSRFVVLNTSVSHLGKEDHGLTERLLGELPGILNWSIEGWKRLRDRGYFVQPEKASGAIDMMTDLASPIRGFVRDCCVVGPTEVVAVDTLYEAWRNWCSDQGRADSGKPVFGRDLHAAVGGLNVVQPRQGKSRKRVYEGIALAG